MDAVELPLPVDVAAPPKLMGSEGLVPTGVAVKEVEGAGPNPLSIIVGHSTKCCSSRHGGIDVAVVKNETEFPTQDELPEVEINRYSRQLPHLENEEVLKKEHGKGKSCPAGTCRPEGVTLRRKAGKVNKSNRTCPKRPRMCQSEDSSSLTVAEDAKDIFNRHRSHHMNCDFPEKCKLPKQRSNAGKRGDTRNFKVHAKAKLDTNSMKLGAAILNSTCGGNGFFGLYGLKHGMHDFTKLMDEPPLDKLLGGTFDCPSLSKEKGKKTSNTSEDFSNSVRKACSILQLAKPVQSQNINEMDNSLTNKKMSSCQAGSVSVGDSGGNGDKGQSCTIDVASCHKDSCCETETPANPPDCPLYEPKDVLKLIALPPSRNLESLLLDASKHFVNTKSSNDLRSGKQISCWPSLPTFTWSHAFSGHCRTNSDAVKLSTSRSTCQGKWAKIGFVTSYVDISRGCFTNLDSFSYNQSLVPSVGRSDSRVFHSLFASHPFCQWDSSSTVACSEGSLVTGDGHSPRLLSAAQTLCEIVTHSARQNADDTVRGQKRTPYKAVKSHKLKPGGNFEEMHSTSISLNGSNMSVRGVERMGPSKKPRRSTVENTNVSYSSSAKKESCAWPTSKSSRSLSHKSVRDSGVENKHSTGNILKQHGVMLRPARVLDKVCNSQEKVRKLALMDWERGREKLE